MKSVNHGQSCGTIPEFIMFSYYQYNRGVLLPKCKICNGMNFFLTIKLIKMILMHSEICHGWYIIFFNSISKFCMWSHCHNNTVEVINEEFS